MASTIAVLLSEKEFKIIQSWINHMRKVKQEEGLSEAEDNLIQRITEQQKFLKYVNS